MTTNEGNKQKKREYMKEYITRPEVKEKRAEYAKQYAKENRDILTEKQKEYRQSLRDKRSAQRRKELYGI